jgi:hypothetical protein
MNTAWTIILVIVLSLVLMGVLALKLASVLYQLRMALRKLEQLSSSRIRIGSDTAKVLQKRYEEREENANREDVKRITGHEKK